MKTFYISMLNTDDEILDFFLVKSAEIKTGSNGKQFLDVLLADRTGEVPSKKWDVAETELPVLKQIGAGDLVKVKAVVTSWNGQKQMKISRIRKAAETDGLQAADFVKAAPFPAEEMYRFVYGKMEGIRDPDFRALCTLLMEENKEKLLYYPAAQKNHHAQKSGLLYHMKRMLETGDALCGVYTSLDNDLVTAGILLHDIEKLNEMISDPQGVVSGYSFEGQLLGHIVQGIKLVDRMAVRLGMPREKAVMLEHMILSHHYEPEYGSPKKPLFPEAEILHYIDLIDSRMFDMEDAMEQTLPGGFSDRIWTLDNRKLYRHSPWDDGEASRAGASGEAESRINPENAGKEND